MTTRTEISKWFDEGVQMGKGYMLILCDTYDWSDYPDYYAHRVDAERKAKFPGEMQKVMEVYDLNADKDQQLNQRRANCFKAALADQP
jgi:hypothetical protein